MFFGCNLINSIKTSVFNHILPNGINNVRQIHHFVDWRMLRDVKRRRMFKEYSIDNVRLKAIRKNDVLPQEIRDLASQERHAFPRDANVTRIVNRCVLTSRPRGTVVRWRISRIMFRHLADYNKLSGIQRAIW